MSVWLAIPSARPPAEAEVCLREWEARGYKIALWLDDPSTAPNVTALIMSGPEYPGYARAVNALAKYILQVDPQASWIVTGGDDTLPDPNHTPEEIAKQLSHHFACIAMGGATYGYGGTLPHSPCTFGVMQPTGDRFAQGSIDRIAGSPWMGREWCERANQGKGPLWPGYKHMHVDEELLCVAEKLGVYWRRPDLVHLHRHFQRASDDLNSAAVAKTVPPHLVRWNSPQHWKESSELFANRKALGFPGHEPLVAVTA